MKTQSNGRRRNLVRTVAEASLALTCGLGVTAANAAAKTAPSTTTDVKRVLGLETSLITDEARRRFNIKDGLKGVVVMRVDPNSAAADKRIQAGDVIVEFGDQPVSKPEDIVSRIEALKKDGKKSAVVVVSNAQGETRFVALSLN